VKEIGNKKSTVDHQGGTKFQQEVLVPAGTSQARENSSPVTMFSATIRFIVGTNTLHALRTAIVYGTFESME
jgi:hypothetical protein